MLCNATGGIGGIRIGWLNGGTPPYKLKVEREMPDQSVVLVQILYFYEEIDEDYVIPDLQRGRYIVTLTDRCNKKVGPYIIDLCNHCGYNYEIGEKKIYLYDEIKEALQGIVLELKCACGEGCLFTDSRIDIDVRDIVWAVTTLNFPGESFECGPVDGQDPQPDNRYYISEPFVPFDISVSRDDGCEFKIPINWSQDE